jgi:glucose-6-phosphate isomerase
MALSDAAWKSLSPRMEEALSAMSRLEGGAIANLDENRMVGHYWLRDPSRAPEPEIRQKIENSVTDMKRFMGDVLTGAIVPERGDAFYVVLVLGIGGSALGPQFVCDALGNSDDPMMVRFIDNTDPDGIHRVLAELDDMLEQTLTVVVSKSGTTIETRNAMLEVAEAYRGRGLHFARHASAVTCEGSGLDQKARKEKWLRVFPLWDWVGGRTSIFSAAGLLPIGLQGIDVDAFLLGARECDEATRRKIPRENPACLLAASWHAAGDGQGRRNMVVLPYRDRLVLLGRFLQQLVMESLGKSSDRSGRVVHQGLTVYGNKGSTDQHAFVQQLRDGPDDFFVAFVEVLKDCVASSVPVEERVFSGDYLHGFLYGTRSALTELGRQSLTLTLLDLNARSLGGLIALWERAVGLYAELINVNAYHQPGVEAGKKAAAALIDLQRRVLVHLGGRIGATFTAEQIAQDIGEPDLCEEILHLLEHAAANPQHGVLQTVDDNPKDIRFGVLSGA